MYGSNMTRSLSIVLWVTQGNSCFECGFRALIDTKNLPREGYFSGYIYAPASLMLRILFGNETSDFDCSHRSSSFPGLWILCSALDSSQVLCLRLALLNCTFQSPIVCFTSIISPKVHIVDYLLGHLRKPLDQQAHYTVIFED